MGMFQQIVIDFVKGLDIVTGRHYNVGDFVELDGKTGHVIDFSVKHTRIRTASGQEYNLPNSRCIPSRRFPDGYVDNYVDIPLKSACDSQRARRAIVPVCRHLSRRIEQVKEQPKFVERFSGSRPDSVVLRYRVRVLPACEWIITEQFLPAVKTALAVEEVELSDNPTFFFINRIQTFRQLFSRELTEEEILRETSEPEHPAADRPAAEPASSAAETTAPAPV
jgi:small-conductance mechanosensitive channel